MTAISVVIPTHQRRALVTRNVAALEGQTMRDFEVIVVDDGSTDGTTSGLRELRTSFPLTVLPQSNRGRAAACNAGADLASGDLILFMDDDMEAHPELLAQHQQSHAAGAEVVLGDLPLHPDSPRNLLSWGVGRWAQERRERLISPGAELTPGDLITGQMSISRVDYARVGGFDQSFTREGLFGGEDTDFGYRVRSAGLRIEFNPDAISYQYYDVDPAEYLKRAYEAGRSSHELLLKHPHRSDRFGSVAGFKRRRDLLLFGTFVYLPAAASRPLRSGVAWLARTGHSGAKLRELFFIVRTMERKRGLRDTRRAHATGSATVLAYHAVADHRADRILRRYSVPPQRFVAQLDALARWGWKFISADDLLAALDGRLRLPRKAVLVTFDDAYRDFEELALPELRRRGIPSVVFVVAELIGSCNQWDADRGATEVALMDGDALRRIAAQGVELGSHGLRHRPMSELNPAELTREATSSADLIEALGVPRPRLFAYPHGEHTPQARRALRDAGYVAAFSIDPGLVVRPTDPWMLPRVMLLRGYRPALLRIKLAASRWPGARVHRWLARAGGH